MAAAPDLEFLVCRARFRAMRPVRFDVPAANRFRGAMGFRLPEELFRPKETAGPSGMRDRPRPFVLRAGHLDGLDVTAGAEFSLALHLFWVGSKPFKEALSDLGWAQLEEWSEEKTSLSLAATGTNRCGVRVEFLTPTELKPLAPPGQLPPFEILMARLRDRISGLRSCYGPGPLEMDFRGMAERAAQVRAVRGRLDWVDSERVSGRTGQQHPLGGFTGAVEYEGEVGEFVPWLGAGFYTGVGRQTVWGKGVIRPDELQHK